MKKRIISKGRRFTIEILTIDENYHLSNQEKIEHHVWHKGITSPMDTKRFIYVNGYLACVVEGNLTLMEVKKMREVKETIEHLR